MFKKLTATFLVALILGVTVTTGAMNPVAVYAAEGDAAWCANAANKNHANFSTHCNDDGTQKTGKADGATNGFGVTMNGNSITIKGDGFGQSQTSAWQVIFDKYQTVITGISGIGTLSMFMFFIWNAILLGKASTDPGARQKAVTGLIWSGAATMVLGSAALFVGVFYGMLGK